MHTLQSLWYSPLPSHPLLPGCACHITQCTLVHQRIVCTSGISHHILGGAIHKDHALTHISARCRRFQKQQRASCRLASRGRSSIMPVPARMPAISAIVCIAASHPIASKRKALVLRHLGVGGGESLRSTEIACVACVCLWCG